MANDLLIISVMLFLLRVFQRTEAGVPYYMSQTKSTWEAASKECTLATPLLDLNNRSLDIPNQDISEDVWIGYYLALMKFEILGCLQEKSNERLSFYSTSSPGRCFSFCDYAPYFGFGNTTCLCFGSKPINISPDLVCDMHCKGQNCKLCNREGYITLYQIYTSGDDNVQYVNINMLSRLCSSGSTKLLTPGGKHYVKKENAILKYGATIATLKPPQIKSYGHVSTTSNGKIEWIVHSSGHELRALCVRVPEETKSNEDSNLYIVISVVVSVCVTALIVALVIILKRRNSIPKFCRNDESIKPIKEQESTNKGGTSHRGIDSIGHMNPAFNKSEYMNTLNVDTADDNYDSSHYSSIVEEPRGKVNQPIESQSVKIPDVQHLHAKMESNLTDQNAKGSDKDGSPSPHYFILEKIEKEAGDPVSTKDLTRIEQQSMVKDNERNVYNTLNEAKIEMSDNVYDITERTANKSDATYDTTGTASSQRNEPANYNSVVIGDDEYSHTGRDQIKYSKTDNVYGMQDQQGIPMQQFDKEDLENSETYNHLNMTKFNKNKTDNLYGFSKD
ncbi:uncharacterized protein LOC132758357 [Ruditapes philippinarum]|uniref:uncharacterized protein LOC132758357 n=1 Tax=Ruditapes philippinarum TaxID=129788 RepID=UPI00295B1E94|nr:uncharacterized protein LOC132758357 [Ruditapes philippinarum]